MNILKNQYNTAKEVISKLEILNRFHKKSIELKYEPAKIQERFEDLYKKYNLFMVLMGNVNVHVYSDPTTKNEDFLKDTLTECKEYFAQYEKELLEAGAIEYGDTLSDEQKLAYYHQQEFQQLNQQECQY